MKQNSKVNEISDKIFWGIIYLIPIICFIIFTWQNGATTIATTMQSIGLGIVNDNMLLTALESLFGASGYIPIFTSNDFLIYATYYMGIMLIHFTIDILMIIIRWGHDQIDKAVK